MKRDQNPPGGSVREVLTVVACSSPRISTESTIHVKKAHLTIRGSLHPLQTRETVRTGCASSRRSFKHSQLPLPGVGKRSAGTTNTPSLLSDRVCSAVDRQLPAPKMRWRVEGTNRPAW